ncbi:MAG: glutamate--tRNA ligase [Syntrophorhabdaceae bacterium]|nr:glutamate--tRNA ligase [Syntrophorhabdaceae bacterium]
MVKVRFAPSPTGHLHIGNARTAVLNYLFAKKERGIFSLRIEDTDIQRSNKLYESSIIEDLQWLGINWDEGPVRQTERFHIYKEYAEILLEKGFAYRCFCSKDELDKARRIAVAKGIAPKYDGRCKKLSKEQVNSFLSEGRQWVIRFKSFMRPIKFDDMIHGEINFPYDHVDDFIIMRSDGVPSYNFAVVVDDMLSGITHVIRGADHISNTPKQIMLFHAFGGSAPLYAHHSLLMGPDKKPLSKRHGVTGIKDFKKMGILKEALVNYLGITGRSMIKEFLTEEELINTFDISSLSQSDSVFDMEKLLWLNKEHLKHMPTERLINEAGLTMEYKEKVEALKENVKTIGELKEYLNIFDGDSIDSDAMEYISRINEINTILKTVEDSVEKNKAGFEDIFNNIKSKYSYPKRELILTLRIILTGKKSGPPIKEIFPLISKESIIKRIQCIKKSFSIN